MIDTLDRKYFKLALGSSDIKQETDDDISAKCPVCGDSHYKNKHRLHLYTKNNITLVHCFNGDCPVVPQSMYKFLKNFFPNLFDNYRREKNKNILQNLSNEQGDVFANLKTAKSDKESKHYDTVKLALCDNLIQYFTPIKDSNIGLEYLNKRGFDLSCINNLNFYVGKTNLEIGNKFYKLKDAIIIPLLVPNETGSQWNTYGFYSRLIQEKMFYTYIPEYNIGYKIWNWFNVNKEEPVYIFEGIFDALSAYKCGLTNVIACMGAKLPQDRIDELKNPIFCLDNDRTGLKNMLSYSEKYKVYIQPDTIKEKDMNEILLAGYDCKDVILSNIFTGILANVKLHTKL